MSDNGKDPASFNGIEFPFQSIEDEFGHALAEHRYPKRPGADLEAMGRDPFRLRLKAVFIGADYPALRDLLIEEIRRGESGDFYHPEYGTFRAKLKSGTTRPYGGDALDAYEMDIEVWEDSTNPVAFEPKTDTARAAATDARAAAASATSAVDRL